jgi:hypothetical protein
MFLKIEIPDNLLGTQYCPPTCPFFSFTKRSIFHWCKKSICKLNDWNLTPSSKYPNQYVRSYYCVKCEENKIII